MEHGIIADKVIWYHRSLASDQFLNWWYLKQMMTRLRDLVLYRIVYLYPTYNYLLL